MKEVDFNGDGVLQFKEFVFLMRFLGERPEVCIYCTAVLGVGVASFIPPPPPPRRI